MKRFFPSMDDVRAFFRQSWSIASKELSAYFGSPIALIFVGVFLAATLTSFFTIDAFFARNIADVRPLFRQMPVLLIILVPALTMRQWSEEQRAGTLEVLLTLPVRRASLVLGKFAAVVALVFVSLALTLYLPLSVDRLGDLDWGPVAGGYLAALLMASAYAAVGLLVSSRTDNQIVALIVTVLLCVALYGVGTRVVTDLVGETTASILRAVGTGSRFESIERGVIDLRDLLYYVSLTVFFLVMNVVSLDAKRWSTGAYTRGYRFNALLRIVLVGANLLAMNVWLFPIHRLRADLTANKEYSLSPVTRDLVNSLQEPLLIRGYISEQTHPLLAPLVPTLRDMLREYQVVSGGRITAEVVDPRDNEDLEVEANQVYGIRPVPFRISGRYEDSVINSYFDILIRYGDQSEVLGFQELIEIEQVGNLGLDVRLRNIEYDLTRSIKKVVYGFQSLDAIFAGLADPVELTLVVTPAMLPEPLQEAPDIVLTVAQEMAAESGGKFTFDVVNPDDPNSPLSPQALYDAFGIQPYAVSLFSADVYYLHLLLQIGDEVQVLYPGGNISQSVLRTELESALKRNAPGFLKTVGLWHPSEDPVPDPYTGSTNPPLSTWQQVRAQLGDNYTVQNVDLASGRVPGDVDVLVVVAPQGMTDKERFAVDQYLMRGGAVIVAAANYVLSPQQYGGGILLQQIEDGFQEMLASYGVTVEPAMVMDPQNEPFPVQVPRQVGGVNVIELQQVSFPFFVDVRSDAMDKESAIVANLPAVTLQWASPLLIDEAANADRDVTVLLRSSEGSWLRTDLNATPNLEMYPELGFPVEGERASRPLAVSIRGSFDSYFRGRPSPFEVQDPSAEAPPDAAGEITVGTIDVSPSSARLVVIGSGEFLDDVVLGISQSQSADRYLHNLQLLQNAVDWAVEDEDLLSIRSRGTYARLLRPMQEADQQRWELGNYAVALLGLLVIAVVWYWGRRNEQPMIPLDDLGEQGGEE
jgi:ABC-2 type transport system permease protein